MQQIAIIHVYGVHGAVKVLLISTKIIQYREEPMKQVPRQEMLWDTKRIQSLTLSILKIVLLILCIFVYG